MSEITIATSIIPRNFELQRAAIDSWLTLGFNVISLNSAEEATLVAQNFPDIPVTIVNRTAESTTGKPYIYFDDVRKAFVDLKVDICGIVNSDIFLNADSGFNNFISETVADGLLFGSRIDVESMSHLDGEKFVYGFDFFFFNKEVLKTFPESDFCLGIPWWDYWAPFVPLVKGVPCKELISPVAFHGKHETKWEGELFYEYGKKFASGLAHFRQKVDQTITITVASSPQQLTVYSLDILHYILTHSDKVVYPHPESGELRLEVGRLQYLRMREQVIEHKKEFWELQELIRSNNAASSLATEIEELRASPSWRITKPLRWLADRLRARG